MASLQDLLLFIKLSKPYPSSLRHPFLCFPAFTSFICFAYACLTQHHIQHLYTYIWTFLRKLTHPYLGYSGDVLQENAVILVLFTESQGVSYQSYLSHLLTLFLDFWKRSFVLFNCFKCYQNFNKLNNHNINNNITDINCFMKRKHIFPLI